MPTSPSGRIPRSPDRRLIHADRTRPNAPPRRRTDRTSRQAAGVSMGRSARGRGRATAAGDGPRLADDPVGRRILRAPGRTGLLGDPVRQPRRRPLDDHARAAHPQAMATPDAGCPRRRVFVGRYGRRHDRSVRSPGHRGRACDRRLDGWDDRPADGHQSSGAGLVAGLDHVQHGEPARWSSPTASGDVDAAQAPERPRGLHRGPHGHLPGRRIKGV